MKNVHAEVGKNTKIAVAKTSNNKYSLKINTKLR